MVGCFGGYAALCWGVLGWCLHQEVLCFYELIRCLLAVCCLLVACNIGDVDAINAINV